MWEKAMKSMNYKPGWWAAYFFYCLIPIVLYIWYLLSRRSKDDEVYKNYCFQFNMSNKNYVTLFCTISN